MTSQIIELDPNALRSDKLLEQQKQIVCNQIAILDGSSVVTTSAVLSGIDLGDQDPEFDGTDEITQITFGSPQSTTEWDLDADGTLTCNVTGTYILNIIIQYGRESASGTSVLFFRKTTNGAQGGPSVVLELENANSDLPLFTSDPTGYTAGDEVKYEFFRDDAGDNSGGLRTRTPTNIAWAPAGSALLAIFKQTVTVA